jgi:hypothetical protein
MDLHHMTLTLKQKRLITIGKGDWAVARQLEKKNLATIVDSYRDDQTFARKAVIERTDAGETLRRKIEDPTVDHL